MLTVLKTMKDTAYLVEKDTFRGSFMAAESPIVEIEESAQNLRTRVFSTLEDANQANTAIQATFYLLFPLHMLCVVLTYAGIVGIIFYQPPKLKSLTHCAWVMTGVFSVIGFSLLIVIGRYATIMFDLCEVLETGVTQTGLDRFPNVIP